MTCGDGEWGAEVYGCASDRQQASIVFDVAVDMVDQCPALKKRIKPVMSVKRLVYKPTNSFYQVLSAEAYTKHGLNVHAVIFDELHAQPNRELFDVMTKGSGDARTQPLYFLITTAGTDRNSICFEQHQKAVEMCIRDRNSSMMGCVVLDPFLGSGSTLMACEQTGRICYGVELEEKFVDVIVNRYMEMKGSADEVFVIRNNVKIPYWDLGKEGEANATADLP